MMLVVEVLIVMITMRMQMITMVMIMRMTMMMRMCYAMTIMMDAELDKCKLQWTCAGGQQTNHWSPSLVTYQLYFSWLHAHAFCQCDPQCHFQCTFQHITGHIIVNFRLHDCMQWFSGKVFLSRFYFGRNTRNRLSNFQRYFSDLRESCSKSGLKPSSWKGFCEAQIFTRKFRFWHLRSE